MSYGEPADTYFPIQNPKARKEHLCCGCAYIIEKGQVYVKQTGTWSGEIHTYKMHDACWMEYHRLLEGDSELAYHNSTRHLGAEAKP